MRPLDTDPDQRHPGAPDTTVIGPFHVYGNPNMDIPACTRLGFPPLGGKVAARAQ